MPQNLSDAQRTMAAYSYFTLDEWKLIARGLRLLNPYHLEKAAATPFPHGAPKNDELASLLTKLPSASL